MATWLHGYESMKLQERLVFAPLTALVYGWSALLVCALLALDQRSWVFQVFVGRHFLLAYTWGIIVLVIVWHVWQRQLKILFRRSRHRRAALTIYHKIKLTSLVILLTLFSLGISMPSPPLLEIARYALWSILLVDCILVIYTKRSQAR